MCKENDNDDETEYMYSKSFEETEDPVTISGEAGISIWVEVEIDIAHGEIECGIAARTKEGAKDRNWNAVKAIQKELEKKSVEKEIATYRVCCGRSSDCCNQSARNRCRCRDESRGEYRYIIRTDSRDNTWFSVQ